MKSKSALLAATLTLLITTSSTFADEAFHTYTETEMTGAAPKKAEAKSSKDAEKTEPESADEPMSEPADKSTSEPADESLPVPRSEIYDDPCSINRDLPGCIPMNK